MTHAQRYQARLVVKERERCASIADAMAVIYRGIAVKASAAKDREHEIACLARAFVSEDIAREIRAGRKP